ncbi:dienelactone hydrolase family protein [Bradyrhizobium sp. AZCC 2289]|uniref:dienelactone hydrolase family protein n=1 Tax=Bradyrhizobium sp. AZCC 2289 TaxID=3117026 RepID=UPI002FEF8283
MNSIEFFGADRETLSAPLVLPKSGKPKVPGIVLLPAIAGMNDYVRSVAHRLSASGFAVAILDYFAREGRSPDVSSPAAIDVAVNSLPDHRVIADACGLVGALREHEAVDPERIGSLGFCIGGMYSLMLSAESPDLSASVDYYGLVRYAKPSDQKPVSPLDRAKDIQAPFLAHFGTFDRLISAADIEALEGELKRASKPYELFSYNGAPHAFDEDFRPVAYRPVASKLAWQRTMTFLDWHLKGVPAR